ncbi:MULTISPECIES: hypothetical protein [Colwellia]|uniref:hypothetical protein n=1 Tax=Colwellia TaxID=28228 RepID=UPI0012F9F144|nr:MULTISPECIES: hypothetical protein [Colwellia]
MNKIITVITLLFLTLFISTASAQSPGQEHDFSGTAKGEQKTPIIIFCMPFPSCEKDEK